MAYVPKVTVEIDGLEELKGLLEKAEWQAQELRATFDQINIARLIIQAKINQPEAGTNG